MSTSRYCFNQALAALVEMAHAINSFDLRALKNFGNLFSFYLSALGKTDELDALMNTLGGHVKKKNSPERFCLIKEQFQRVKLRLAQLDLSDEL